MPRLFIAIDLPKQVKDQLAELQMDDIPGARWVGSPQMHLTLKFLGEVENKQVKPIKTALEGINAKTFDMMLHGVGCFPPAGKGNPRVVWVGIVRENGLNDLHRKIENAMTPLGFEPERRRFSPHITLARLKNIVPRGSVSKFINRNIDFQTERFPVNQFILYSSVLAPSGPTYTHEQVYTLGK